MSNFLKSLFSKTSHQNTSDPAAIDAAGTYDYSALLGPIQAAAERYRKPKPVISAPVAASSAAPVSLSEEPQSLPANPLSRYENFTGATQAKTLDDLISQEERDFVENLIAESKKHFKAKDVDSAIALLLQAEANGPAHLDVHRLLGEGLFIKGLWRESIKHWYRASTLQQRDDEKMRHRIKMKVMRCNAQLAMEALDAGEKVKAAEYMSQAVAAIDYSVYVKVRTDMIAAITRYIMEEIGPQVPAPRPRRDNPKRIAIILDVIKISKVHTHKHLYLSLAASLAALDPEITIDLIATYERQVNWNAGYEDYYRPETKLVLEAFIQDMVPEDIRDRINVRYYESFDLDGLAATCKDLLEQNYDLALYGSGKHGYHGNESLLVRHMLYPYTPTAFFFVQSNNEVDELNDVIVARGKHPIEGAPGSAKIEYQAYPPFPGLQAAFVPNDIPEANKEKTIVVTAWVGIRLDKTLNGYKGKDINKILDVIDAVPGAEWHLIGAENPDELLSYHGRFWRMHKKGQIVIHPVLDYKEFYTVVQSASLFLQPAGITGGGGGASIARNNNVPIICYRHSDVAPLQPQDYVFEEDDLQSGMDAALTMLTDPEACADLVNRQLELMYERRASSPIKFYDCMRDAVATYNARIKT